MNCCTESIMIRNREDTHLDYVTLCDSEVTWQVTLDNIRTKAVTHLTVFGCGRPANVIAMAKALNDARKCENANTQKIYRQK